MMRARSWGSQALAFLLLAGCAATFRLPEGPVWGFTSESAAGARIISYATSQAACEQWRVQTGSGLLITDAKLPADKRLTLSGCRQLAVSPGADYWVSRVPYSEIGMGATTLADCEMLRAAVRGRGFSASACTQIGARFVQ